MREKKGGETEDGGMGRGRREGRQRMEVGGKRKVGILSSSS